MDNKKTIKILFGILVFALLFFISTISNAETSVTRDVYSNNGSMKFYFTGLTLDTNHEYSFGLTKTSAAEVETWYQITDYTESTATIDLQTTTSKIRTVINAVDTGYITIKDITDDEIILESYGVNLKIPYLKVTNYTVIPNGKDLFSQNIQMALRCASNSTPYYQYEKITDQIIIDKYKEIKAKNGDVMELESMLKTTAPSSNWTTWEYWNGYDSFNGMNGFGYTQRNVSAPDNGLYYMWVYFSGNNLKDIYGYILVDNLEDDVALEGISITSTAAIKVGNTQTLTVTFNPSGATNKIVTWSSSDETVAKVNNAGVVTGVSVGSAIITAVSEDGNYKATSTVTVTEASSSNENTNSNTNTNTNININTNSSSSADTTVASGNLPKAGKEVALAIVILAISIMAVIGYIKVKEYNDIK